MRVFNKLAAFIIRNVTKSSKENITIPKRKQGVARNLFRDVSFLHSLPFLPPIFFSLLRSDPLSRSGAEHRLSIFGAFRARESHMVQGGCKRSTSVEQNLKIEILRHNLKNCYFRAF